MGNHKKLIHFLLADPAAANNPSSSPRSMSSSSSVSDDDATSYTSSSFPASTTSSPSRYSPPRSPWSQLPGLGDTATSKSTTTGLIASLVKGDGGKVYSLACAGDVLYTGTDSETVRVWRDRRELGGFRTGSGLVKAIVVSDSDVVFTGHQDGKIRVWRASSDHRRVGTLPAVGWEYLASSRGRRRRVRHADAVSCLSLDARAGLLYSGSWDRTLKVWRVWDHRCLDSVPAHDDAVNAVAAAGFGGLVFSGSADGTVKVWRRQGDPNRTRHVLDRVLRTKADDGAVTAIAVCAEARIVYVGSSDGLVACWRWVSGEPVPGGALAGHKMGVMCLAVSGTVVVSGSADGTLCVWRRDGADHHSRVAVLAGHAGPVKCVAVADDEDDDGRRFVVVYSGSLDGSVKVWRLASHDRYVVPDYAPSPAAAAPRHSSSFKSSPPRKDPRVWGPPLPSPVQQPWRRSSSMWRRHEHQAVDIFVD